MVFACGALGTLSANALSQVDGVAKVDVVVAPWRSKEPGSFLGMLRQDIHLDGFGAVARRAVARLARGRSQPAPPEPLLTSGVTRHTVTDLHDPGTLNLVRGLAPDLGIVAGTYILREKLFSIPRFGSINLHSGKAPAYRGAAPAFWELYNGEESVGITIHRVVSKLDAGDILLQELFPLERAPTGDPLEYIERYRAEVLRPNGVRMLCDAVRLLAAGDVRATPQNSCRAHAYRTPDYRTKRELRRRVAARRRQERRV